MRCRATRTQRPNCEDDPAAQCTGAPKGERACESISRVEVVQHVAHRIIIGHAA